MKHRCYQTSACKHGEGPALLSHTPTGPAHIPTFPSAHICFQWVPQPADLPQIGTRGSLPILVG